MFRKRLLIAVAPLIVISLIAVTSNAVTVIAQQSRKQTGIIAPLPNSVQVTATLSLGINTASGTTKITVNNDVGSRTVPAVFHLDGVKAIRQGWNDCGPANITQALQFYGWQGTQEDAVAALKPNYDDLNVSAWELVRFVNEQTDLNALTRVGGTLPLLKQLVAANIVVIVEVGYSGSDGWTDHFLTILGFDDSIGMVFVGDTLLNFGADGLGQRMSYAQFDQDWHELNRGYIVVFPTARQAELKSILGINADLTQNAMNAVAVAKADNGAVPDNGFYWFNLGSSLTILGQYQAATVAFDRSRIATGVRVPWQIMLYQFAPYEAYYNAGQYDVVLALANEMLATPYLEETWYWRGMVEAVKGETEAAMNDFDTAIRFNPGFTSAVEAEVRLEAGLFTPPTTENSFAHTAPGAQP